MLIAGLLVFLLTLSLNGIAIESCGSGTRSGDASVSNEVLPPGITLYSGDAAATWNGGAVTPSYICGLCKNSTRLLLVDSPHSIDTKLEDDLDNSHLWLVRKLRTDVALQQVLSTPDATLWLSSAASPGVATGTSLTAVLSSHITSMFLDLYPSHYIIATGGGNERTHSSLTRDIRWVADLKHLDTKQLPNAPILLIHYSSEHKHGDGTEFLPKVQSLLPIFTLTPDVTIVYMELPPLNQDSPCYRPAAHVLDQAVRNASMASSCSCDSELSADWIISQSKLKISLKKLAADFHPMFFTTRQVRAKLRNLSANVLHTSHGQISQIGTWTPQQPAVGWLPLHGTTRQPLESGLDRDWSLPDLSSGRLRRSTTANPLPCNVTHLATLKGATITVATIIEAPFVINSTSGPALQGFSVDLLNVLAAHIGFNYTLRLVKDGQFGSRTDGQWNGLVGELTRCEVDFVSAPLTISAARAESIHFSVPYMQLGLQVAVRKSYPGTPSFFQFLSPLSSEVWIITLAAGIVSSMTMSMVNSWSPYSYRNARALRNEPPIFKCDCAIDEFTFYNALWFMVGSFAQQGADKQPLSPSGRVIGMSWYMFGLVIINTYIANLAAFLTTSNNQHAINDITSLPFQTALMYGTVANSQPASFFSTTQVASYQRVWEGISANPSQLVRSADAGLEKVRSSSFAFIWDSPSLRYAAQRHPCDIEVRGNPFDLRGYGFAMPIGSLFRDEVSNTILKLQDNGAILRLQEKWWTDRTQCRSTASSAVADSQVITTAHVFGLIMVMAAGVVFSLLVLGGEVFYYNWKQSLKGADTVKETMFRWSGPRFKRPTLTLPLSGKSDFVATMTRRSMFSRRGFGDANPLASASPANPVMLNAPAYVSGPGLLCARRPSGCVSDTNLLSQFKSQPLAPIPQASSTKARRRVSRPSRVKGAKRPSLSKRGAALPNVKRSSVESDTTLASPPPDRKETLPGVKESPVMTRASASLRGHSQVAKKVSLKLKPSGSRKSALNVAHTSLSRHSSLNGPGAEDRVSLLGNEDPDSPDVLPLNGCGIFMGVDNVDKIAQRPSTTSMPLTQVSSRQRIAPDTMEPGSSLNPPTPRSPSQTSV